MILAEETVSVDMPLHVSLPAFVPTSACSGLTRLIHLKYVSLFGMTSAFPVRERKKKSHPTWGGECERDVKVFVGAVRLLRIRCKNVKQCIADSWEVWGGHGLSVGEKGFCKYSSEWGDSSCFLSSKQCSTTSQQSREVSHLLGAAQHVTLRTSDPLLQDPALLLHTPRQEMWMKAKTKSCVSILMLNFHQWQGLHHHVSLPVR